MVGAAQQDAIAAAPSLWTVGPSGAFPKFGNPDNTVFYRVEYHHPSE